MDLVAAAGGQLHEDEAAALLEAGVAAAAPAPTEATPSPADAIDPLLRSGWLRADGERLVLQHDLVRQGLAAGWPRERRQALHGRLLGALRRRAAPAARLVLHAHGADLAAEVLALAPLAAQQALARGAAREAADLMDLALPHIPAAPADTRAGLWVAHAEAQARAQRLPAAIRSRQAALALHRASGQAAEAGEDGIAIAKAQWLAGALPDALAAAEEAARGLARHGSPMQHARAQATMAQLHMFDARPQQALEWGLPALARFEAAGDAAGVVDALNTVGFAQAVCADDDNAWAPIRRCRRMAQALGLVEQQVRACVNMASLALVQRRLDTLDDAVAEGLPLALAQDLDLHATMLHLRSAWGLAHRGHWAAALVLLDTLLQTPNLRGIEREQALSLQALLWLRQGRAEGARFWRDALAVHAGLDPRVDRRPDHGARSGATTVDPWYAPPALTRVEAAWLLGDNLALGAELQQAWPAAMARGERWRLCALAVWWQRTGAGSAQDLPAESPRDGPGPLALELRGQSADAARTWQALGCPYDAALAGAAADIDGAARALEQLGAVGSLAALRRQRRAQGLVAPGRGRGQHTRADPLGLTPRERAVLDALCEGLSNRAIAERLGRSERTVENHVAALLGKLQVRSRAAAVAKAGDAVRAR